MISKTFYHVTTPERAEKILLIGFDDNINPNYECSLSRPMAVRVYLSRKRNIPKWIRILSKEQGWKQVAILQVTFTGKLFSELFANTMKDWYEPFIADWGDQIIFQFDRANRPTAKIELLKIMEIETNGKD